ncbi:hypothetical protein KC644_03895 [Candidatus Berkelbacteria bacterium]|nr:hypothetical protein [Candidatus Berkelbacteria bacterium]
MAAIIYKNQRLAFLTIVDYFSFRILFKTLFQPWKRDQISTDNLSLQDRFQVWTMNGVARLIGFAVRSAAIAVGLAGLVLLLVLFGLMWATWLTAPVLAVYFIIAGLISIFGGGR